MRKILFALVLLSLLVVPMMALAQGPIECCKIRRPITIDGEDGEDAEKCGAGQVAGPEDVTCPTDLGLLSCPTGVGAVGSEKWGLFCLINTINTVVDWIFVVLIVLTVLFVLLGAIQFLTAAGSPEKVTAGKNYIMWAAIGLAVAFVARAVPSIVKAVMGY